MIKLSKKWPSWRSLQGLWLISSLLEQEIQIKPNRSWEKRRSFWILTFFTFCLIVGRVFVIETITGSQIKAFLPGVWNLVSDLRKTYPAECQIMVSSRCRDIERVSKMSKKKLWSNPDSNVWQQNIKFQNIWDYWFYWNSSDKEKSIHTLHWSKLILIVQLK